MAHYKCLRMQAKDVFDGLEAFGQKRGDAKRQAREEYERLEMEGKQPNITKQEYMNEKTRDKIYSYNTYGTYAQQNNKFLDFCEETYGCKTLKQCRPHAEEWLQRQIDGGNSAWTVNTARSALAKLYQCPATDFDVNLPQRQRGDVIRSRGYSERDSGFSLNKPQNVELLNFGRGVGARRSELERMKGTDLTAHDDGSYTVRIKGKGGKVREAPVLPEYQELVVRKMQEAGENKVYDHVHSHLDVHGECRDVYARKMYDLCGRSLDELEQLDAEVQERNKGKPAEDREESPLYRCRLDKDGVIYDRDALLTVGEALGHNRYDVTADSYLDSIIGAIRGA